MPRTRDSEAATKEKAGQADDYFSSHLANVQQEAETEIVLGPPVGLFMPAVTSYHMGTTTSGGDTTYGPSVEQGGAGSCVRADSGRPYHDG